MAGLDDWIVVLHFDIFCLQFIRRLLGQWMSESEGKYQFQIHSFLNTSQTLRCFARQLVVTRYLIIWICFLVEHWTVWWHWSMCDNGQSRNDAGNCPFVVISLLYYGNVDITITFVVHMCTCGHVHTHAHTMHTPCTKNMHSSCV